MLLHLSPSAFLQRRVPSAGCKVVIPLIVQDVDHNVSNNFFFFIIYYLVYVLSVILCNNNLILSRLLLDISLQSFQLHADIHFKGFLRSGETGTNIIYLPVQLGSLMSLEFPIWYMIVVYQFSYLHNLCLLRLGSKAPYPTPSTAKVADSIENNFCADNAPDLVSLKRPEEEVQPTITAS